MTAFSDSIPLLQTRPAGVIGINMQFATLKINAQEVVMAFFLDVAP
jgi:type IV secretory pathway VirB3-like protein